MKDRFIDLLKSRENCRMIALPKADIVTFSLLQAATIKGFIHGKQIRQNAVLGYFPDPIFTLFFPFGAQNFEFPETGRVLHMNRGARTGELIEQRI